MKPIYKANDEGEEYFECGICGKAYWMEREAIDCCKEGKK